MRGAWQLKLLPRTPGKSLLIASHAKKSFGKSLSQLISLSLFTASIIVMPQAVAAVPVISTTTVTVINGFLDPTPIIIGADFAYDADKFDFAVDVGATGLEFDSVAFINDSHIRFNFHGVAQTGVIKISAYGTAYAPANQASSNELTITVLAALSNQTITFAPLKAMEIGQLDQTPFATSTSGLPVSLLSNVPSICTIDFEKIHPVSAGVCSIKAIQSGNSLYNPALDVTRTFIITSPIVVPPVPTEPTLKDEVASTLGSLAYNPEDIAGLSKSILFTDSAFGGSLLLKVTIPPKATLSETVFLISTFSSVQENATGYFTAKIIGVTSNGTMVRKINGVIEIETPAGATDALPYWSHDGEHWYQLAEVQPGPLPKNLHAGFYVNKDKRITILTDYLMLFGLKKPQAPLTIVSPVKGLNPQLSAVLKIKGGSGQGPVNFRISTEEICSVTPAGIVKGLAPGQCLVTASKASSSNFADIQSNILSLEVKAVKVDSKILFNTGPLTHSLSLLGLNGSTVLEVSLCSIYANEQANVQIGTKNKKKQWIWKTISTAALDDNGAGIFLIKAVLPKDGQIRVLVNGVIQMETDI